MSTIEMVTGDKNDYSGNESRIKIQKVKFPYFMLCDNFEVYLIMSPSKAIKFPVYLSHTYYKKTGEICTICKPKAISGNRLAYPFRLSSETFANIKIGKVKFDDEKEELHVIRYSNDSEGKVYLVGLNVGEIPVDKCDFIESNEAWDLTCP